MLGLVFAFQFFETAKRLKIDRVIIICLITFALSFLVYAYLFSRFVVDLPDPKDDIIAGTECLKRFLEAYPRLSCGEITASDLEGVEYKWYLVWTTESVTFIRLLLVASWFLIFASLTTLLGAFLVYQRKQVRT